MCEGQFSPAILNNDMERGQDIENNTPTLYLLDKSKTKRKIQKHTGKATLGYDIDALALVSSFTLNPIEAFSIKKTLPSIFLSNAYAAGQLGNPV